MVFKSRETPDRLDFAPTARDHFSEIDHHDTGRSNFAAFLLGGVVVAGSMLAFLYYDSTNLDGRDILRTGSISREAPPPSMDLRSQAELPKTTPPRAMD